MVEYMDITQECYSVTVDAVEDVQEHRIERTVNTKGELPSTAIFVFTIGDADDVLTDQFSRVGNPQDVQDLLNNRDDAIAAGNTEFLSSYMSLQYADLDVAVQAKAMLRTRINELARGWITYRDDFTADSGDSVLYPSSDPDVEDVLKEEYGAAKVVRIAAEVAATEAATAVDDANALVANAQEIHTIYVDFLAYNIIAADYATEYQDRVVTEGTTANGYFIGTLLNHITSKTTELDNLVTYWSNLIIARQSDMETAVQDRIEADQELIAAQEAEAAALAAVLEVDPDFDPNTYCYCP